MSAGFQRDWSPARGAFREFLKWLDEGRDSEGRNYLEMRRRLVAYFDRKNCVAPDELADETLNRVARRLSEERAIAETTPARYCYTVARFVFLEYQREPGKRSVSLELRPDLAGEAGSGGEPAESRERLLHCLDRCLERLKPEDRNLIVDYYDGERRLKIEHRRGLAERLGLTMNALSIRACRIRDKLEACVTSCRGKS